MLSLMIGLQLLAATPLTFQTSTLPNGDRCSVTLNSNLLKMNPGSYLTQLSPAPHNSGHDKNSWQNSYTHACSPPQPILPSPTYLLFPPTSPWPVQPPLLRLPKGRTHDWNLQMCNQKMLGPATHRQLINPKQRLLPQLQHQHKFQQPLLFQHPHQLKFQQLLQHLPHLLLQHLSQEPQTQHKPPQLLQFQSLLKRKEHPEDSESYRKLANGSLAAADLWLARGLTSKSTTSRPTQ